MAPVVITLPENVLRSLEEVTSDVRGVVPPMAPSKSTAVPEVMERVLAPLIVDVKATVPPALLVSIVVVPPPDKETGPVKVTLLAVVS